ncbi:MAG: YncE family protein [Bacteroidales bacterium]|nr:YncE family protein [Bacteroidales bacterium]
MKTLKLLALFLILTFAACNKEKPQPEPLPGELGPGLFILNEGNFNSGNASLSYFETGTGKLTTQLFFKQNNAPLGDVAQSITLQGEKAYIVVNNSGLIYAIDRKTARFEGKLSNLVSPRHILFIDGQKAYVSDLNSSHLTVVDPVAFAILGKIELGRTSEEMLKIGDQVYVANWSAYNQSVPNNKILVVDSKEDRLTDSITVGIEPNSMVVDKNGSLWVLCSGGFTNTENPSLWQIDPTERKVRQRLEFAKLNSSPTSLEVNGEGNRLYFINDAVYRMGIADPGLPTAPFIQGFADLPYQLAVDPQSDDIYLTDALDYMRNGFVFHFDAEGQILDTVEAGVIPGGIGFNVD